MSACLLLVTTWLMLVKRQNNMAFAPRFVGGCRQKTWNHPSLPYEPQSDQFIMALDERERRIYVTLNAAESP